MAFCWVGTTGKEQNTLCNSNYHSHRTNFFWVRQDPYSTTATQASRPFIRQSDTKNRRTVRMKLVEKSGLEISLVSYSPIRESGLAILLPLYYFCFLLCLVALLLHVFLLFRRRNLVISSAVVSSVICETEYDNISELITYIFSWHGRN